MIVVATLTKESFSEGKYLGNVVFLSYEAEKDENEILLKYNLNPESWDETKLAIDKFLAKNRRNSCSTKDSMIA